MTGSTLLSPHPMRLTEDVGARDLVTWTACPVCDFEGARATVGRLQDEPRVELLECPRCRAASASMRPTDGFLDSYYRKTFTGHFEHYGDAARVTIFDVERFARALARRLPRRKPTAILDFGGQDGSLARELARQLDANDARIVVVDRTDDAVEDPRIGWAPDLRSVEGDFDLVLASASLEHVPEVGAALDALLARLAPGGHFYARTPYAQPLLRLVPDFDFGFPAHLHDLGPGFWNGLASRGVELVHSAPSIVQSSWRGDPWRWIVASTLKLPAHLEVALRGTGTTPAWALSGGWEVVARRPSS